MFFLFLTPSPVFLSLPPLFSPSPHHCTSHSRRQINTAQTLVQYKDTAERSERSSVRRNRQCATAVERREERRGDTCCLCCTYPLGRPPAAARRPRPQAPAREPPPGRTAPCRPRKREAAGRTREKRATALRARVTWTPLACVLCVCVCVCCLLCDLTCESR